MFPSLKVRLSGLDDEVLYIVYVEMDLVDDKRYRYIYQRYIIAPRNLVKEHDQIASYSWH